MTGDSDNEVRKEGYVREILCQAVFFLLLFLLGGFSWAGNKGEQHRMEQILNLVSMPRKTLVLNEP